MRSRNLQWIDVPIDGTQRNISFGEELLFDESTETELRPIHDPRLAPRDEMIFLLHTAAEVEHALMAQYLFAAWSVPQDNATHRQWRRSITDIAKQEMGHLATVQNILRAIGGSLNFEREDYPFRSGFYPFNFRLQPLSVSSLAKYIIAEMPENTDIPADEMKKIVKRAKAGNEQMTLNRVGLLYKQILDLLDELDDTDFMPHSKPFQAQGSHWFSEFDSSIPLNEQVIVSPVANKADARDALCKIAVQGEGMTACLTATVENSHFDRFLKIYRERDAEGTEEPMLPITPNPNTLGEPVDDPELEKGRIKNKTARRWAQLFNLRYRMLLAYLSHYFYLAGDVEAGGNLTPRGFLRNRALFGEMPNLSIITAELIKMSQSDDGGSNAPFAGPPFEMDYTLAVPDLEIDRWRLHRDLITAAGFLEEKIISETGDINEIIGSLKTGDAEALEFINRQIA